jgi:glycosyltransferase involved in cell wall biosynthesis
MSEIVEPTVTGALLRGDDPADLARLIAEALADDTLYENCRARAGAVASWFTWDRAAGEAVAAIAATLGHGSDATNPIGRHRA